MMKIFGLAAAALLLSGGGALAKSVTVTISLLGQTCSINVITQSDMANNVYNREYVIVNSNVAKHDCSFNGEGLLAKAAFVDSTKTKDVQGLAIISGHSPYLQFVGVSHITLTLTTPFVTGGRYTAYYYNADGNGDATSIERLISGAYSAE